MDYTRLAALLFPDVTMTTAEIEEKYPPRELPEGAKVTRFAPSPTGFVHFGGLFGALTDERLARQSGGVVYLRIEDTDSKREIEGGVEAIIKALEAFGISFDEGATIDGERGEYGPYRQSERKAIYRVFARELVAKGHAYPCFCTPEELASIREEQKQNKENIGYYGKYAKWRDATLEDIEKALSENKPFVIRFRSEGSLENKIKFTDLVKGELELTENDIDHVLLKSDGTPNYHLAHAVDDHLMKTTHVVRSEEWLPSLPFHLQLFDTLGFRRPKYCHTAQVMKMTPDGGKRKISKRCDPEAALDYYHAAGYPVTAVNEYVMTLLNSNFEEWRIANKDKPMTDFAFSLKKMSTSGCLFDFAKLDDMSRNVISQMTAEEVLRATKRWAKQYDREFYELLAGDEAYAVSILSIGRGGAKPRKDITVWSGVKDYIGFFFDKYFTICDEYPDKFEKAHIIRALEGFIATYNESDEQTAWFDKIKDIARSLGYAGEMKEYKKAPESFPGSVADVSMFIRVAVTGRINSPDLYSVMNALGRERVIKRITNMISKLR